MPKSFTHCWPTLYIIIERSRAATTIQAQYRGYRTRNNYKKRKTSTEDQSNINADLVEHNNPEKDEAATKIQAHYRGYKTRNSRKHSRRNDSTVPHTNTNVVGNEIKKKKKKVKKKPTKKKNIGEINMFSVTFRYLTTFFV